MQQIREQYEHRRRSSGRRDFSTFVAEECSKFVSSMNTGVVAVDAGTSAPLSLKNAANS